MKIDPNKVIDIQSQRHGQDKANDSRQISILLAENEALKEEIERLKKEKEENAE